VLSSRVSMMDEQQIVSTGGCKGGHGVCQIEMLSGPCGRELWSDTSGVDRTALCVMHSADPGKNDVKFQDGFVTTLKEAGEKGLADFANFVFPSSNYQGMVFKPRCRFFWAIFKKHANFGVAEFPLGADFSTVTFEQDASFAGAKFGAELGKEEETDFSSAQFLKEANFLKATFGKGAMFWLSVFNNDARFNGSRFGGIVDFTAAKFLEAAAFRETEFKAEAQGENHEPTAVFCGAVFDKPEKATFYRTYLGQALFHNCDVSRVGFSDVFWRERNNHKNMVLDEVVDPECSMNRVKKLYQTLTTIYHPPGANRDVSSALQRTKGGGNPRDYRLIEELYQELKRNYDDQADYRTAGDFHYGELEVMRQRSHHRDKLMRWMHTHLGLIAWYKYVSEYGESYVRPGWWLGLTLVIFMFLYPAVGLHGDGDPGITPAAGSASASDNAPYAETLTYWHPFHQNGDKRKLWRAEWDLVIDGGITSLEVASFQKSLMYPPSYRRGRLLELVETLLTSTLAALFLLAVRRRFKR
jgi:uncharacterized protein YjbI with pentapeptide repeats